MQVFPDGRVSLQNDDATARLVMHPHAKRFAVCYPVLISRSTPEATAPTAPPPSYSYTWQTQVFSTTDYPARWGHAVAIATALLGQTAPAGTLRQEGSPSAASAMPEGADTAEARSPSAEARCAVDESADEARLREACGARDSTRSGAQDSTRSGADNGAQAEDAQAPGSARGMLRDTPAHTGGRIAHREGSTTHREGREGGASPHAALASLSNCGGAAQVDARTVSDAHKHEQRSPRDAAQLGTCERDTSTALALCGSNHESEYGTLTERESAGVTISAQGETECIMVPTGVAPPLEGSSLTAGRGGRDRRTQLPRADAAPQENPNFVGVGTWWTECALGTLPEGELLQLQWTRAALCQFLPSTREVEVRACMCCMYLQLPGPPCRLRNVV